MAHNIDMEARPDAPAGLSAAARSQSAMQKPARLQPAPLRVVGGMCAHMAAASSRHSAIPATCSSTTVVQPGAALIAK